MIAAVPNAMNIVCSRPILSDTQPKNGRPNPSKMRSSEIANVNAAIWKPRRLTGVLAILKSLAIGAICAAVIKPRSEEHTSELQSPDHLVCRLLLEKKK